MIWLHSVIWPLAPKPKHQFITNVGNSRSHPEQTNVTFSWTMLIIFLNKHRRLIKSSKRTQIRSDQTTKAARQPTVNKAVQPTRLTSKFHLCSENGSKRIPSSITVHYLFDLIDPVPNKIFNKTKLRNDHTSIRTTAYIVQKPCKRKAHIKISLHT